MEKIHFLIEDADGKITRTKSKRTAEIAYQRGNMVTEVKTISTYTEHTRIVLKTYETKNTF